jgi:hypothetical protein
MNERIKDLLEEAGFVSYGEDTGFYNIPAPAFLSRIDRFAELIVKECAKFLEDNSGYGECNDAWHPEPEELLEHFGVDE